MARDIPFSFIAEDDATTTFTPLAFAQEVVELLLLSEEFRILDVRCSFYPHPKLSACS
jgi:hypothetical protein